MQLPPSLRQFAVQHGSVQFTLELLSFPHCLHDYEELIFVFFLVASAVLTRFTLLTEYFATFFYWVFILGSRIVISFIFRGLFAQLVSGVINAAIAALLHDFFIHLRDNVVLFAAARNPKLLERPLLLPPNLLNVDLPVLELQYFDQRISLIDQLSVFTAPAQLVQVALQVRLDSFETFRLLAELHEHQFQLFDLTPHVFKTCLVGAAARLRQIFLAQALVVIELI